jgi:hypothetical protein
MSEGLPSYVIMAALVAALQGMAAPRKGLVVPAYDPAHAMDMLANAPEKWRVIVAVDDESDDEASEGSGKNAVSATEFITIIQAGSGLPADPGRQIFEARAGDSPSVLEIAEAVRSFVRGIAFTHESLVNCASTFKWKKSTWVANKQEGKPAVYGRQHVFLLQHAIEFPVDVDPVAITWPA